MPIFKITLIQKLTYLNTTNKKRQTIKKPVTHKTQSDLNAANNLILLKSKITYHVSKKISASERLNFTCRLTQQLHLLLDSGLIISDALHFIAQNETTHKALLNQLLDQVNSGTFFHQALQQHPDFFSAFYIAIIQSSEQSGTMASGLNHLHQHLTFKKTLISSIKKSLTYPCCLLISTLLACYALSTFILPKFSELFSGFNQSLPAITQTVIAISHSVKLFMPSFFILFALFFLTKSIVKKPTAYRFLCILFKFPLISSLLITYHRMILCQVFSISQHQKIPLLDTLDLCKQATSSVIYRTSIEHCIQCILQGATIESSFAKSNILSQRDLLLIASAEKSNRLTSVFQSLTKQYTTQFHERIHSIKRLIEPTILILLSGIIGVVILAIYLPIFNMGNTF